MSREADIERVGNVLAGTMALYWLWRGVMIFSMRHRDACTELFDGLGTFGSIARASWFGVSAVFFVLGALVVWRPADPRLHFAQAIFIGVIGGWFSIADPGLWFDSFGPLSKEVGAIAVVAGMSALVYTRDDLYLVERRLHLILAMIWMFHGAVDAFAPPQGEIDHVVSLFAPSDAGMLVRLLGALQLFAGIALWFSTIHGPLLTAVLWGQMLQFMIVPALVVFGPENPMLHPLAPLAGNLPLLGATAALWYLGRLDDVRFYGALKAAERAERAAFVVCHLQGLRFGDPFQRIARENRQQYRGTRGILEKRHRGSIIEDALLDGVFWLVGSILLILPHSAAISSVAFCERWSLSSYAHCLETLPDVSLSRRMIEDIMQAKNRHLRWLRDAA